MRASHIYQPTKPRQRPGEQGEENPGPQVLQTRSCGDARRPSPLSTTRGEGRARRARGLARCREGYVVGLAISSPRRSLLDDTPHVRPQRARGVGLRGGQRHGPHHGRRPRQVGADLMLADINGDGLCSTVARSRPWASEPRVVCDVSDPAQIRAMFERLDRSTAASMLGNVAGEGHRAGRRDHPRAGAADPASAGRRSLCCCQRPAGACWRPAGQHHQYWLAGQHHRPGAGARIQHGHEPSPDDAQLTPVVGAACR